MVTVHLTDRARIPLGQRGTVDDLGAGFHRVDLTFGFMEEPDVPAALRDVLSDPHHARLADAVYFIGMETLVPTDVPGMALWRERLYVVLHRNASSAARYFCLPRDRIVVVGAVIDI